ncbi:MAG: hypothetical protein AAFO77_06530 [Pseudomonadota bacterium]
MTAHGRHTLESVLGDVATARGLPNEHYVDEETFAAETKHLFACQWAALAFANKDAAAIVTAYEAAGDIMLAKANDNAGYYLLAHAYSHALEAGLPGTADLEERLKAAGRL